MELHIDAASSDAARLDAERAGFEVLGVRPARSLRLLLARRREQLDVVEFGEELIALLEAGLTLVESIDTLARRASTPAHQAALGRVVDVLRRGARLADALETSGAVLPQFFIATVRASEGTGTLTDALSRYLDYERQLEHARSRIVSAAIYPGLVLAVGALVMLFLLAFVVPRFSRLYKEVSADLPWGSRLLMELGQLIDGNTAYLVVLAVTMAATTWWWVRSAGGRHAAIHLLQRIPGLRPRIRLFELARLYRTMSLLLRSGVSMLPAIQLVRESVSPGLAAALARASGAIREGQPLSRAFDANALTTEVAARMLLVAERTGSLSDMLERIAAFHERELTRWIERATRLFEPVLMAFIGLIIGVIVILMYMPIFDLAGSLR